MSASIWISFKDAAELAGGLHPNTFRQRKAGTEHFTHVQVGRRVMLIRSELEEWIQKKTNQALAENRKRTKNLHLVTNRI